MTAATIGPERDDEIFKLAMSGMTNTEIGSRLNLHESVVRNAIGRVSRATGTVVPKRRITGYQAKQYHTLTVNNGSTEGKVSLPPLRFLAGPQEPLEPRRRIVTPVPELTEIEALKMRRLALLKQVHREGLARGLFATRSR